MQRLCLAALFARLSDFDLFIEHIDERGLACIAAANDEHLLAVRVLIVKFIVVSADGLYEITHVPVVKAVDLLHALLFLPPMDEHLGALRDVSLRDLQVLLLLGILELAG
eukprot:CAMPEP_0170465582 /NCGR_PEP_ID=MMETSP0123-20130129/9877_1 /TAXON_ID=182087 /ORGANISM="Favella ehrenbergii, Strain Fehren 1" /LENGTH=109 /DNA_ID=CAMNT_0010731525 /DNA_START=395 /DNA_END=724 /DNA_ORIENTATION=+